MISDEIIQAALIAKMKTFANVVALLPVRTDGTSAIKELQWQGDTFEYPAVRLDIEDNSIYFDEQERCTLQEVTFSVYIFSEERSSKQCSQIKGLLINNFVGKSWTGTGVKFIKMRLADNSPAIRQDERTWRSSAQFRSKLHAP